MISATPPAVNKNSFYSPKETAALLGIHRNTLNMYRQQLAIKPQRNRLTGRFLYSGKEIERFWYSRIS